VSLRFPYKRFKVKDPIPCFTATYYGDREEVELTINPTYPGR
jgi:hypothetical protein